jgi:predicted esterase YcpF (UPF0227 family)
MSKGTLIYLHGFASSGKGFKPDALRKAFPECVVFSPDLPVDPDKVISMIDNLVRHAVDFPVVFVGTSLGGFWANYFAHKWDAPCVIVNPSTSPSKTMFERVGKEMTNYVTGEKVEVTMRDVKLFSYCEIEAAELHNGALVNVFVAKDDDVIDYKETLDAMRFTKSMTVLEDGVHRFEAHCDKQIDKVKEVLAEKVAA